MINLYVGNSHSVLVTLVDSITKQYISTATGTVSIADTLGTPVPGITWPVALVYSGANGVYTAAIENETVLVEGTSYVITLSVDYGTHKAMAKTTKVARVRQL